MRSVGVLVILIAGMLAFALGRQSKTPPPAPPVVGRKCVGADPCNACKNCRACAYCSLPGKFCGKCKPTTRPKS